MNFRSHLRRIARFLRPRRWLRFRFHLTETHDPAALIDLAYRVTVGRAVEPDALTARLETAKSASGFVRLFVELAGSEEAQQHSRHLARYISETESSPSPADLIAMAYRTALGRDPDATVLPECLERMQAGAPFASIFAEIARSEEAQQHRRKFERYISETASSPSPADLIAMVYRTALGRDPEATALTQCVERIDAGAPFASMFVEIAGSDEAFQRLKTITRLVKEAEENDLLTSLSEDRRSHLQSAIVEAAYKHVLRRMALEEDVQFWTSRLAGGLSPVGLFHYLTESEEARTRPAGPRLGPSQTDGAFLVGAGALLYGRGLLPQEVTFWQGWINGDSDKRDQFAFHMINEYIRLQKEDGSSGDLHDSSAASIMGTARMLTKEEWDARRREVSAARAGVPQGSSRSSAEDKPFVHSGSYKVSMIASLYKGRDFITQFLDNMTSQTLFASAELIIIDADSPEREHEVIEAYQRRFPNIVYRRINYRIGIYDAWNVGIELSRGQYLTNTNLDDLRRCDSIALQAAVLDTHDHIDVVYQDFYYSMEPFLAFDEVAACGFTSELPIITPHNLLAFNSPHNGPMWRRVLHDELGKFNTHYRSAGDFEFWSRCLAHGKRFRKLNSPHISYYFNPEGLSTRPDTRGILEARDILRLYSPQLISPTLLRSRTEFQHDLGMDAAADANSSAASHYDLAQTALLRLGGDHLVSQNTAEPDDVTPQPIEADVL